MHTRLAVLRQVRNETQAVTARAIGTDRSTYAHIEIGRTTPSLRLAFRIARHFGQTVDSLFGDCLEVTHV